MEGWTFKYKKRSRINLLFKFSGNLEKASRIGVSTKDKQDFKRGYTD